MNEPATIDAPVESSGISEGPSELDQIASDWAAIQAKNAPAERDEGGKFAAKADDTGETVADQSGKEADPKLDAVSRETTAAVEKASPLSWKKEVADKHWASLSPELQDEILRREEAVSKGFESHKLDAQIGQAFTEVMKPYMPTLQAIGIQPDVAIRELMSADNTLRHGSPAQRAQMAARIIGDYGVSLDELNKVLQGAPTQVDPAVQSLNQRLQAMEAQQRQREQQSNQAEEARLSAEIASFAQGKPHFKAVEMHMASLLQGGVAKSLQEAYDMAIFANPTTRAVEIAQHEADMKAEAAKKAESAKKAAAANIKARGTLPTQNPSLPEKQQILEDARRLGLAN